MEITCYIKIESEDDYALGEMVIQLEHNFSVKALKNLIIDIVTRDTGVDPEDVHIISKNEYNKLKEDN